jgi:hypothetical protein
VKPAIKQEKVVSLPERQIAEFSVASD